MEKIAEVSRECDSRPVKLMDLNHADFFRLRSAALEIVEELKLRRTNDTENEERLRHLVKEKYDFERNFENETAKTNALQEQNLKETQDVKRKFEEKLHSLKEEVKQQQVHRDCSEREAKALKDEVRGLQLDKYSLEKRLREQEHKLQLQTNSLEQHLSQLSALQQKCQNLSVMCQDVSESQIHLEKNVMEAVKLNRTLMYVNDHQKCVIEQQKSGIAALQNRFIQLNVQIQSQPVQTSQIRLEQEITILQQQIGAGELMKESLAKEVGEYKEKYQANLRSLTEAHLLIERHLQRVQSHERETETVKEQLSLAENTVSELKGGLDQANKNLDVEKDQFKHALDKWKGEEEGLKEDLRKVHLEVTGRRKAQAELEDLNSDWSKQNMELHQQLTTLRKKVEVEKKEEDTQTVLKMLSMKEQFCQTEIQYQVSESQTDALDTRACSTQTLSASYSNSACQATKVVLLNQENQTVDTPRVDSCMQTAQNLETVAVAVATQTQSESFGSRICNNELVAGSLDNKNGDTSVHNSSSLSSKCDITLHVPCATSSPNILYTTASEAPGPEVSEILASHLDEKISTEQDCFGRSFEKKSRMCFQIEMDHDISNNNFSNDGHTLPIDPLSSHNHSEAETRCGNGLSNQNMDTSLNHNQRTPPYSLQTSPPNSQTSQLDVQKWQQSQQMAKLSLSNIHPSSRGNLLSGHYDDHTHEQKKISHTRNIIMDSDKSSSLLPTGLNRTEADAPKRLTIEELQYSVSTPIQVFNPLQIARGFSVKPEQSPNAEIRKRLELVSLSQSDSSSYGPNSTVSSFSATESMLSSNLSSLTSELSYHTAQSTISSDSSFFSKTRAERISYKPADERRLGNSTTSDASVISPTPQLSPFSHYASLMKRVQPPASKKRLNIGLATKFSSAEKKADKNTAEINETIQSTPNVAQNISEDNTRTDGILTRKKSILKGNQNMREKASNKSVRFAEQSASVTKDNKENHSMSAATSKSDEDEVSGDQSLFSDGEDESIELGSQLKKIETMLQGDKITRGRKRKYYDKV